MAKEEVKIITRAISNPNIAEAGIATRWKKGYRPPNNTGRRGGRSASVTSYVRRLMEQEVKVNDPLDKHEKLMKIGRVIATRLVVTAMKGNMAAIREVMDRLEGRPAIYQKIESDMDIVVGLPDEIKDV